MSRRWEKEVSKRDVYWRRVAWLPVLLPKYREWLTCMICKEIWALIRPAPVTLTRSSSTLAALLVGH
jgi:hypothetical protein